MIRLIPETHPNGLSSLLSEIQNRSCRFCELAALLRFPITFSKHKKSPHKEGLFVFGGGGENRTRVRKSFTFGTTCLGPSLI